MDEQGVSNNIHRNLLCLCGNRCSDSGSILFSRISSLEPEKYIYFALINTEIDLYRYKHDSVPAKPR